MSPSPAYSDGDAPVTGRIIVQPDAGHMLSAISPEGLWKRLPIRELKEHTYWLDIVEAAGGGWASKIKFALPDGDTSALTIFKEHKHELARHKLCYVEIGRNKDVADEDAGERETFGWLDEHGKQGQVRSYYEYFPNDQPNYNKGQRHSPGFRCEASDSRINLVGYTRERKAGEGDHYKDSLISHIEYRFHDEAIKRKLNGEEIDHLADADYQQILDQATRHEKVVMAAIDEIARQVTMGRCNGERLLHLIAASLGHKWFPQAFMKPAYVRRLLHIEQGRRSTLDGHQRISKHALETCFEALPSKTLKADPSRDFMSCLYDIQEAKVSKGYRGETAAGDPIGG